MALRPGCCTKHYNRSLGKERARHGSAFSAEMAHANLKIYREAFPKVRKGWGMDQSRKSAKDTLRLEDRLIDIAESEYPRFSAAEMTRRRAATAAAMAEMGVDHLVAYGSGFRGGPVTWLAQWLGAWRLTVRGASQLLLGAPGVDHVVAGWAEFL